MACYWPDVLESPDRPDRKTGFDLTSQIRATLALIKQTWLTVCLTEQTVLNPVHFPDRRDLGQNFGQTMSLIDGHNEPTLAETNRPTAQTLSITVV